MYLFCAMNIINKISFEKYADFLEENDRFQVIYRSLLICLCLSISNAASVCIVFLYEHILGAFK